MAGSPPGGRLGAIAGPFPHAGALLRGVPQAYGPLCCPRQLVQVVWRRGSVFLARKACQKAHLVSLCHRHFPCRKHGSTTLLSHFACYATFPRCPETDTKMRAKHNKAAGNLGQARQFICSVVGT